MPWKNIRFPKKTVMQLFHSYMELMKVEFMGIESKKVLTVKYDKGVQLFWERNTYISLSFDNEACFEKYPWDMVENMRHQTENSTNLEVFPF